MNMNSKEKMIHAVADLPSFITGSVIRIIFRDVRVNSAKRQLPLDTATNRLNNQLSI